MFDPPKRLQTSIYATVPEGLEISGRVTEWLSNRHHRSATSVLEGPAFDRQGNLYCVDVPFGRVFKIDPERNFSVFVEYDGEPNGIAIHKDGRLFIADQKCGILAVEPDTRKITGVMARYNLEGLRGPNDLTFASNGDLYFTDQGQSGWQSPTGRVIRIKADGRADIILDNIPSPNGIAFSPDETTLYLAVTRTNAIWQIPFMRNGDVGRVGTFIQLSGGVGPDGLAVDEKGNLAICHTGLGVAWLFSKIGEPIYRMDSCTGGLATTNLAYGGAEGKTLFITESATGNILTASLPVAGKVLYSHQD